MGQIVFTIGSKENFFEDVNLLASRWSREPRIVTLTGPAIRPAVTEKASALFIEENLVLALLDPSKEVIRQVEASLLAVSARAGVIIYSTSDDPGLPPSLGAVRIDLEQEREKRIKERVLAAVRADGKKMSDKAFALFKERIRDEALMEGELAKLISYVGEKGVIEAKDVAAVVTEEQHEQDLIALSDAMARRNKKEMLGILETLLGQGMNILAVHGFMTRYMGLLLQAKDREGLFVGMPDFRSFSKAFGQLKEDLDAGPLEKRHFLAFQKPFYAYNLFRASRKYTREDLLAFLDMLAHFDAKVKKGTRHDRTSFEAGLLEV
jgi:hypothetical protein